MFSKTWLLVLLGSSALAFVGGASAQTVTVTAGTDDDYLFTKQRFLVSDERLYRVGGEIAGDNLSFAIDDYGKGANEETDYTLRAWQKCFGDLTCTASVAYWDTRLEGIVDYALSVGGGEDFWWSVGLEFQDGESYESLIPTVEAGYAWVIPGADWLSLELSGGVAHDSNSKTTQLIWRVGPAADISGISASVGWYGYVPLNQTDDGSKSSFGFSIAKSIDF